MKSTSSPGRGGYRPGAGRKPLDPASGARVNFVGCRVAAATNPAFVAEAKRRGLSVGHLLDEIAATFTLATPTESWREYADRVDRESLAADAAKAFQSVQKTNGL